MSDGSFSQEHWSVPTHGPTPADPDGIVVATAHRDGTVVLQLTCGAAQAQVRLDICRAAQLSTGIWEAAGAAQQLTDDDQRPPTRPPTGAEDPPAAWQAVLHAPPRHRSPKRRRPPANQEATRDAMRTVGLRIRRLRKTRYKSLAAISGLAGMSISTLHRIEHGQRELTLSEIAALAGALQVDPTKLITLPTFAPLHR